MDFPSINPTDYFSGESWTGSIPEKVLLYTRGNRKDLDSRYIHYHSRFNLIVSLKGSCRIFIDRKILYIPPQSVMLIHPWQIFRFIYDDEKPIEWIFFGFDWYGHKRKYDRNSVRAASKNTLNLCHSVLDLYSLRGAGDWSVPYLMVLLEELAGLSDMTLRYIPDSAGPMNLVLKIQKYIFDHLDENLSVSRIAEHCNYSESRLRTIFREKMGISLGSYIIHSRMNEAARKLGLTRMSVTEISDACGFSSVYTFSRGFKNLYGLSPIQYRKQMTGER